MTKRGRVPKPVALKKLQGTDQPCRAPKGKGKAPAAPAVPLPELPAGAPSPPADLAIEAQRIWHDVVPELLRIGTLERTDLGILSGYCTLRARVQVLDALAAAQPVVKGKAGPRANPAGVEARKLWPLVEKLATDLGLHYAARARAGTGPGAVDQDAQARRAAAEKFLFGREPFAVIQGGRT